VHCRGASLCAALQRQASSEESASYLALAHMRLRERGKIIGPWDDHCPPTTYPWSGSADSLLGRNRRACLLSEPAKKKRPQKAGALGSCQSVCRDGTGCSLVPIQWLTIRYQLPCQPQAAPCCECTWSSSEPAHQQIWYSPPTGEASGLSTVRTVLVVVGQYALIALAHKADRFLSAGCRAAGRFRKLRARGEGCHAPRPLPRVTTIPDLVHAANIRLLETVAPPPRLGFVKARPMVLRPGAFGPCLTRFHPVQLHERPQ
jgi:hypothetical protein